LGTTCSHWEDPLPIWESRLPGWHALFSVEVPQWQMTFVTRCGATAPFDRSKCLRELVIPCQSERFHSILVSKSRTSGTVGSRPPPTQSDAWNPENEKAARSYPSGTEPMSQTLRRHPVTAERLHDVLGGDHDVLPRLKVEQNGHHDVIQDGTKTTSTSPASQCDVGDLFEGI